MRYAKLILFFCVCLLALQHVIQELVTAMKEVAPTRISVDHWEAYRGQRWLEVDGCLAVDRAAIRPAYDQVNRAKGNVFAFVPIVASQDGDEGIVHAVAVIGPLPGAQVHSLLRDRAGPVTIRGEVGDYDRARILPNERLDPEFVYINENTNPIGDARMWFFLLLLVVLVLFSGGILCRDILRWFRPTSPPTERLTAVVGRMSTSATPTAVTD